MVFLDSFFNTIFGPLLKIPPFWGILILSLIISVLIVLIYKWMTNQQEMKALKDEIKNCQTKIKSMKNEPEKAMELQKKAMQVNMKYMGKSMKPTLITFIPILLIFGWMQAHFAYSPLLPDTEFSVDVLGAKGVSGVVQLDVPEGLQIISNNTQELVDGKATFKLKGEEGSYATTLTLNNESVEGSVLVTNEKSYAPVTQAFRKKQISSIVLSNEPVKVLWKLSWIWTYILFSIVFSIALRKVLKVY